MPAPRMRHRPKALRGGASPDPAEATTNSTNPRLTSPITVGALHPNRRAASAWVIHVTTSSPASERVAVRASTRQSRAVSRRPRSFEHRRCQRPQTLADGMAGLGALRRLATSAAGLVADLVLNSIASLVA